MSSSVRGTAAAGQTGASMPGGGGAPLLVNWPEVRQFLALIGRDSEPLILSLFPPGDGPNVHLPYADAAAIDEAEVERKLQRLNKHGLGLVMNHPLPCPADWGQRPEERNRAGLPKAYGASNPHIRGCIGLFAEGDGGLTLEAQAAVPGLAGLPEPTLTLWTGGKSLHSYWLLPVGEELHPLRFQALQKRLARRLAEVAPEAGIDESLSDLCQVMRLPGGRHPSTGEFARIHGGSGQRFTASELEAMLPAPEPALGAPTASLSPVPRPSQPAGAPVPLEALLPASLERLALEGASKGRRDDDCFAIAAAAVAMQEEAARCGLPVEGTAESVVLGFARQCTPPFSEREALLKLASAQSAPRQPDPGAAERIRYQQDRRAGRTRATAQGGGGAPPSPAGGKAVVERPPTFRELLIRCLGAIRQGDRDSEMEIKAELKTRFRMTDEQISTELFKQCSAEKVQHKTAEHDSVRLSAVEGLRYRMDGHILVGDLGILYGPYGTGKTTLAIAKMYAHATGRNLLDRDTPCEPGKCLFIATDSGAAALKKSLSDLGIDPDEDPLLTPGHPDQRIWIWAHEPDQGHAAWICDIHGVLRLEEFIRAKGITYVAIDSAKAVSTPAGWSYCSNESVKALLQYLREVVAQPTGAFIEFLSHDGTEKGSHSGAKAWAEDPSMVCALSVARDEDGRPCGVTAQFRKDRAAVVDPRRSVTFTLSDGELKLKPGSEVVGSCAEALLTILWEAHERGVEALQGKALIDEAFARFKRSRKTVENTLARIAGSGKGPNPTPVLRPRRGLYALSPAEVQRRSTTLSASRASRPLPESGGIEAKPIAAEEICHPPYETPDGGIGGNGNPRTSPSGEVEGGTQMPVPATDLAEIPPDAGKASRASQSEPPLPQTAEEWVELALQVQELEPTPGAIDSIAPWLEVHPARPGLTRRQISDAIERLRSRGGGGSQLPLMSA